MKAEDSTTHRCGNHLSAGWEEKSLSDVASIRVSNVDKKSIPGEIHVRLCNYIDVYSNRYITKHLPFMEATATKDEIARFGVQLNDVMITKDSETPDDIGVPAVAMWTEPHFVCGYHLALLRPDQEQVNSVFLAKQLCTHQVVAYYGRLATGSTRYGLSTGGIGKTPLLLPDITHQRKIAKILTTLDNLIEKTESLIAKSQAIKQGMMHDLLTFGIGGNNHPPVNREGVNVAARPLPLGWRTVSVSEIVSRERQGIMTGPFGAQLGTADFVEDGVPVLRIANVQSGYLDLSELQYVSFKKADALSRYRVIAGDLLFARSGATTGRNALASEHETGWLINYHIIRVAVDPSQCDSRYLYACFNSELLLRQVNQEKGKGTREGINTQAIAGFRFALPPLTEQIAISDRIDSLDERIAKERQYAQKMTRLRAGLMQDLLTGKVPVKADEAEEVTS